MVGRHRHRPRRCDLGDIAFHSSWPDHPSRGRERKGRGPAWLFSRAVGCTELCCCLASWRPRCNPGLTNDSAGLRRVHVRLPDSRAWCCATRTIPVRLANDRHRTRDWDGAIGIHQVAGRRELVPEIWRPRRPPLFGNHRGNGAVGRTHSRSRLDRHGQTARGSTGQNHTGYCAATGHRCGSWFALPRATLAGRNYDQRDRLGLCTFTGRTDRVRRSDFVGADGLCRGCWFRALQTVGLVEHPVSVCTVARSRHGHRVWCVRRATGVARPRYELGDRDGRRGSCHLRVHL